MKKNKSSNSVQLLTLNNEREICYLGFCKLKINTLLKYLTTDPILTEDHKPIITSFDYFPVIKHQNILYIASPNNSQDLILVFKNTVLCKRIFFIINQYRVNHSLQPDPKVTIKDYFLIPLFRQLHDQNIVKIISNLIQRYNETEKSNLANILKESNLFESAFMIFGNKLNFVKKEMIQKDKRCLKNARKRKFNRSNKFNIATINKEVSERSIHKKMISCKNVKIISSNQCKLMYNFSTLPRRLIVYTSEDCTNFHEYYYLKHENLFICNQCKRNNTANVEIDENGKILVKISETKQQQHSCNPSKNIPENYVEIILLKHPNYEIIQPFRKTLIIFDSENRGECYEYRWHIRLEKFHCRGCCITKRYKGYTKCRAKLYNEGKGNEYLELINGEHICKKFQYDPEKYHQFKEYVLRPNYEIHNVFLNGKERKKLIIFDGQDRSLCYYYYFYAFAFQPYFFHCEECEKKGIKISAKLQKNEDGEEYIILLNSKHICELQKYIPPSNDIILRPPEIEYMKETKTGNPKVFIFDKNDRKMCYVFTKHNAHNQSSNLMYCVECDHLSKSKSMSGYLCIDKENESFSFRIKGDLKHVCQPILYNPDEFRSFKTYSFFYYREINNPTTIKLAIYHSTNKSLCYSFSYKNRDNLYHSYICRECNRSKKRKVYQIAPRKDDKEKEYFEHDPSKHICKPIKVSSISGPNFVKLDSNDFTLEGNNRKPKNPKIPDESKIIKKPNFELQANQNGVADNKLVIFHPEDKSMVREYHRGSSNNLFVCGKCGKKHNLRVTAKLHTDNNNEKFVVLGEIDHICEFTKYIPSVKIIESPDFQIFYQNDKTKNTKLIVFTSSSHEECYEYTNVKHIRGFRCSKCKTLSKIVSAKLMKKKETNEEYIILSSNQHICKPQKFDPQKYQQQEMQKVPESMFELHKNAHGQENRRLIVFTSEKKEKYYAYSWEPNNNFQCKGCSGRQKGVYAKLRENENTGEKYLLHKGLSEHICIPRKYEKEKFKEKIIIPETMFKLCKNTKGEKDKHLIVFTSEKKDLAYKYSLTKNIYLCIGCISKKKRIPAKLKENENGEKFVELYSAKHICVPKKI